MRSTEERVTAIRRRVAQIERRKRQRRNRIAALSSVAACLAVVVACPLLCPAFQKSSQQEIMPGTKQRRAFLAAAQPPDMSSSDFWPLCWAYV